METETKVLQKENVFFLSFVFMSKFDVILMLWWIFNRKLTTTKMAINILFNWKNNNGKQFDLGSISFILFVLLKLKLKLHMLHTSPSPKSFINKLAFYDLFIIKMIKIKLSDRNDLVFIFSKN